VANISVRMSKNWTVVIFFSGPLIQNKIVTCMVKYATIYCGQVSAGRSLLSHLVGSKV
jgi:hypothetical protein